MMGKVNPAGLPFEWKVSSRTDEQGTDEPKIIRSWSKGPWLATTRKNHSRKKIEHIKASIYESPSLSRLLFCCSQSMGESEKNVLASIKFSISLLVLHPIRKWASNSHELLHSLHWLPSSVSLFSLLQLMRYENPSPSKGREKSTPKSSLTFHSLSSRGACGKTRRLSWKTSRSALYVSSEYGNETFPARSAERAFSKKAEKPELEKKSLTAVYFIVDVVFLS